MTDNHNYNTPAKGNSDWHIPLNENFERIDTDIEIRDNAENIGQYSPKSGAKFLAIDTGTRYIGDGSQWIELPVQEAIADRFNQIESRLAELEGADSGDSDDSGTDPDVHLGFEEWNDVDRFSSAKHTRNLSIESAPGRDGNGLSVRIQEGSHNGASLNYRYNDEEGSEPEEAFARYWLYTPESFQLADAGPGGSKLPGFAGRYDSAGWGGRASDGTNGWSARLMNMDPSEAGVSEDLGIGFYLYHAEMGGQYGDMLTWNRGLEKGQWHCIDQYVKLNEPGSNNGVLRAWLDGDLVFDRNSIRFRDTTDLKIEEFWFDVYHGGSWTSPANTNLLFDDLQLKRDTDKL